MKLKFYLKKCLWIVLVLCSLVPLISRAQKYPFEVNTTITPPYSPYLSDYFAAGANKLSAHVIFNDFNEPSWEVKLRLTIESNQIKIFTSPTFIALNPITVTAGVPLILTDEILSTYFDFNNLTFQGITKQELTANGKLPDGNYNFCFEILDFKTGIAISNKSCELAQIISLDEPTTSLPTCASIIKPSTTQNIQFQWQLSNGIGAAQLATIKYQFKLYEVTDPNINPINAINNNKVLLINDVKDLATTSFLYDMSQPTLDAGKRYVYQIRAYSDDGRDLFKNGGLSEVCWFSYGYATGGTVPLELPAKDGAFGKADQQYFKWEAATNATPGQMVSYDLKLVKITAGQTPEQAMTSNAVWHTESTGPTTRSFDEVIVSKTFEPMEDYAWQVTATSDPQVIAISEVRKFRGPGVIDAFWAGQHLVKVSSTTGADLSDLSGTGNIAISNDSARLDLTFQHLKIITVAGKYVLEAGEILNDITTLKDNVLDPNNSVNGHAYFNPQKVKLNKESLYLNGIFYWHLPHAVMAAKAAYMKSTNSWIRYNDFKVTGDFKTNDSADYELADPLKFKLHLFNTSTISIYQNKYTYVLNGEVFLPDNVNGVATGRVNVKFANATQLYYINIENTTLDNNISLVKNTSITLNPTAVIIDFSETESPLKLESTKDWKGVYWSKFSVNYGQSVDVTNQLKLVAAAKYDYVLDNSNTYKAWIAPTGLVYESTRVFSDEQSKFNTFYGRLLSADVKIAGSVIESAHIKGKIRIPFIAETGYFNYTIPINADGFEEGYMDEAIAGKVIQLDRKSGEGIRTNITFKQAVFANRERIDITVDIENKCVKAKANGVEGFKIWGNGEIGFGTTKNGGVPLTTQVKGKIEDNYEITLDSVYAISNNGLYKVQFSGTSPISTDLAGEKEPPRITFDAVQPMAFADVTDPSLKYLVNPEEFGFLNLRSMPFVEEEEPKNEFKCNRKIPIYFRSPACTGQGALDFRKGDPVYGDVFIGNIDVRVRKPAEFDARVVMCVGKKGTTEYWFGGLKVQAANGIPIGTTGAEFSGIEIRLYKHMNHKEVGTVKGDLSKEFDYIPDATISYGGLLGISLQDKVSHGDKFQLEVTGEMMFNSTGGLNSIGFELEAAIVSKKMQGASKPGMNKPKGMVTVQGSLYYNVPNNHLLITASARAGYNEFEQPEPGSPFCAKGNITIEVKPNYYLVALGKEDEKIKITPGCAGLGGVGYFSIKKDTVPGGGGTTNEVISLGVGVSYMINYNGKGFNCGIATCTPYFYFSAEFAVMASFQVSPTFEMIDAGFTLQAQASLGVKVEWPIGGDDNLEFANVSLFGKGTYKFKEKKIKVEGKAKIRILMFNIEAKGEHEFDA